jgi:hypothetical protein
MRTKSIVILHLLSVIASNKDKPDGLNYLSSGEM